ncbi:MAG: hypothetical protein QOE97_3243 [Pseudonocardiales bacterium]|nr:hypothetical protein [Pseudonocardiales bacterium]
MGTYRELALPEGGAFRVHPDPGALPRLTHDGPGRNRYDDPEGRYAVRYAAANLTGAMLETMARFRSAPASEALLAAVVDGEPEPGEADHADPAEGLADWLAVQKVGRVRLVGAGRLVDIHDPALLVRLDKHPGVRTALESSGLGTALNPARLDEGVIRISGPVGRDVTQAVSRALREWEPDYTGLAYRSRLDDEEWCWAIWDDTLVEVEVENLTAEHRFHRRAVQHVARILEVSLPVDWL